MTEILIGADPEVFVVDTKTNLPVPAWGMIPGTKEEPEATDGGATQVDGLALEFNITPARSEEEFVQRNLHMLDVLRSKLPPERALAIIPYVTFDTKTFIDLPPEAKILGCDPDWSAWSETLRELPQGMGGNTGRGASGHIHIGWTEVEDPTSETHLIECLAAVRQLTAIFQNLARHWQPYSGRDSWYGHWGVFRPKKYGVEFRSLSNAWLNDPRMIGMVYRMAHTAMTDLMDGREYFYNGAPSPAPAGKVNSAGAAAFKRATMTFRAELQTMFPRRELANKLQDYHNTLYHSVISRENENIANGVIKMDDSLIYRDDPEVDDDDF